MRTVSAGILAAVAVIAAAAANTQVQLEVQLQAAIQKETVDGDLKAAIEQYGKLAQGSNRAVAATALVRMGQCYEKLGSTEARKAYERAVREFADQKDAVATARSRLALMGSTAAASGVVLRQVWSPAMDFQGGISKDGRWLSFTDWTTGDVAIRDLGNGTNRRVTNRAYLKGYAFMSSVSPSGKQVAYHWSQGPTNEIRLVNTDGTGDRLLYRNEKSSWMEVGGWSPDERLIAIQYFEGKEAVFLAVIAVADSAVRVLPSKYGPQNMTFSPDGGFLAYQAGQRPGSALRDIFALDLRSPTGQPVEHPLVAHPADDRLMGWSLDGNYILFRSNRSGTQDAWLLPVNGGVAAGEPRLVKSNIHGSDLGDGGMRSMGFTSSGSCYFGLNQRPADVYTAEFNPTTGRLEGTPRKFSERFVGSTYGLRWSPDGRRTFYYHRPLFVIRSTGTESDQDLRSPIEVVHNAFWHPGGKSLLVLGRRLPGMRQGLHKVDIETGAATQLHEFATNATGVVLTEDEQTLYYQLGTGKLIVRELKTGKETTLFEEEAGVTPNGLWLSRDGRQLAVLGGNGRARILPTVGGPPRVLPDADTQGAVVNYSALVWSPVKNALLASVTRPSAGPKYELWHISLDRGEPVSSPLPLWARVTDVHPSGCQISFDARVQLDEVWALENFLPAGK